MKIQNLLRVRLENISENQVEQILGHNNFNIISKREMWSNHFVYEYSFLSIKDFVLVMKNANLLERSTFIRIVSDTLENYYKDNLISLVCEKEKIYEFSKEVVESFSQIESKYINENLFKSIADFVHKNGINDDFLVEYENQKREVLNNENYGISGQDIAEEIVVEDISGDER